MIRYTINPSNYVSSNIGISLGVAVDVGMNSSESDIIYVDNVMGSDNDCNIGFNGRNNLDLDSSSSISSSSSNSVNSDINNGVGSSSDNIVDSSVEVDTGDNLGAGLVCLDT